MPGYSMDPIREDRFPYIDAVRGLAALLVVVLHLQIHVIDHFPTVPITPDSPTWWWCFGLIDIGKIGVALFFFVSGFLIPQTLRGPKASLRSFAIKRAFRLYPAYWLSILLQLLAVTFVLQEPMPPAKLIVANIGMVQRFVGLPDLIGLYWTLQIELLFYGMCAALFCVRRLDATFSIQCIMGVLALLCAIVRYVVERQLPVTIFIALLLMFTGDAIRQAMGSADERRKILRQLTVSTLVLVPICHLAYGVNALRYELSYALAAFLFGLASLGRRHFYENRFLTPLLGLGAISYSVYLCGAILLIVISGPVQSKWHNAAITYTATILGTLLVAAISYQYVEKPGIGLGKLLAGRTPSR